MNLSGLYRGLVKNSADPAGLYRVTVSIPQLGPQFTTTWARPAEPLGAAVTMKPPTAGTLVFVGFEDADREQPIYFAPISSYASVCVATTTTGGVALLGRAQTILSWTAPSDGKLHSVTIHAALHVSSTEVGGAVGATANPGPGSASASIFSGSLPVGIYENSAALLSGPGQQVEFQQTSSLTSGTATVYAQIWAY